MIKTIIDIVRDVRTTIDEIANNESDFIGGQDMEETDEIIRSKICEAADFVQGNASYDLINIKDADTVKSVIYSGEESTIGKNEEDGKVFLVNKPDDMLRFLSGTMSCWGEIILETTDAGTEDYVLAHDPVVGATPFRPAIAYGGTVFKFLRAKSATDTATLKYIPVCDYNTKNAFKDEVSINSRLYNAFIYQLAGLTLLTWENQRADDMFNLAMTHMGINGRKE
jgi:hypothetical protein